MDGQFHSATEDSALSGSWGSSPIILSFQSEGKPSDQTGKKKWLGSISMQQS